MLSSHALLSTKQSYMQMWYYVFAKECRSRDIGANTSAQQMTTRSFENTQIRVEEEFEKREPSRANRSAERVLQGMAVIL